MQPNATGVAESAAFDDASGNVRMKERVSTYRDATRAQDALERVNKSARQCSGMDAKVSALYQMQERDLPVLLGPVAAVPVQSFTVPEAEDVRGNSYVFSVSDGKSTSEINLSFVVFRHGRTCSLLTVLSIDTDPPLAEIVASAATKLASVGG